MNDGLFSAHEFNANEEIARRFFADEVRTALWRDVDTVRRYIAEWIPNHTQPIDLLPLPTRPLTLAEKCTLLAAFHDSVEEGEPFWGSRVTEGELPTTLSWEVLVSAASKVVPRPKDSLRTLLTTVVDILMSVDTKNHQSDTEQQPDRRSHETPKSTLIALSELERISGQLRRYLGSKSPSIGLFSWTQNDVGHAGEPRATISLADAAGALQGEPRDILWCGANTWRQSEPLRDERGKAVTTPSLGRDNKPVEVDGKQLVVVLRTPVEYRGVVALEHDVPQNDAFLPVELHTGLWGGAKTELLELMKSAGESLVRIPPATANLWSDINFTADFRSGDGALVVWLSAILVLHERGELIGDLVLPFWHWRVTDAGRCEFRKPGIDRGRFDTSRSIARINDPIRASFQLLLRALNTEHFT